MKLIKAMMAGTAMILAAALNAPAMAQESSYKAGTVWEVSRIDVLPGQFENYMDYLATTWKKIQEAGKAEAGVVEYHVLATNNARQGEPDLVLIVEYKDYMTTAQQEAAQKRVNALLAQDNRKAATAAGERTKMREQLGSIEYQELILK
jgi:quinol monooxygenase YgiN